MIGHSPRRFNRGLGPGGRRRDHSAVSSGQRVRRWSAQVSGKGSISLGSVMPSGCRPPSAVTHSEDAGRRLSFARILSAGLVQTKGLEVALCSRM
jgi:hypothetical protein